MSSTVLADPLHRPKTKRQGVVLTAEQHDQLTELAAKYDCSKNALIRTAVDQLLAGEREAAA